MEQLEFHIVLTHRRIKPSFDRLELANAMKLLGPGQSRAAIVSLAAQLLTFASAILPVLFGLSVQLVSVVLSASLTLIVVHIATLAASTRLPRHEQQRGANRSIASSLFSVSIVTGVILFISTIGYISGQDAFLTRLGYLVSIQLISQGGYIVCFAELVRRADPQKVSQLRLAYSILSALLTLLACIASPTALALVTATSLAYAGAVITVALPLGPLRTSRTLIHALSPSAVAQEFRENWQYFFSLGFGNVASQAPSLALALLGSLAPAWAVLIRLGSGFQTVGAVVVGPLIDIAAARAIREGDRLSFSSAFKRGTVLGLLLASVGVMVLVGGLFWQRVIPGSDAFSVLFVGIVLFWLPEIFQTPIGRMLSLAGQGRSQLLLSASKLLACICAFFFFRNAAVIFAIGAISTTLFILYLLALQHAARGIATPTDPVIGE